LTLVAVGASSRPQLQRRDCVVSGLTAELALAGVDEPAERVCHAAPVPVVDGVGRGSGDALEAVRCRTHTALLDHRPRIEQRRTRDVSTHAAIARAHVAGLDAVADPE